ncbi:MAG: prenyltransferase/squalene oxidase repeat-containing protein [Candidatus Promineifilaceae bacterium]
MKCIPRLASTASVALVFVLLALMSVSAAEGMEQAGPFSDQRDAALMAIIWVINENQNEDGGFGTDFGTGEPASSISATLDAILAMSAVGYSADQTYNGASQSAVNYLRANSTGLQSYAAVSGGANGKVILALTAANKDPRTFAIHNYVQQLQRQYDDSSGSIGSTTAFDQSLAIMALSAVSEPVPEEALAWLESLQADDGSWDDGFGTPQNSDATGMALMALFAGGRQAGDSSVNSALDFLKDSQLDSGGWEYGSGFGENANSTAIVVQALSAAGQEFSNSHGVWSKGGASPLDALMAWQAPNGAFQADYGQGRFDDLYTTVQGIPAVAGRPYPLPSRSEAVRAGIMCLAELQDPGTAGWEQFAGFGVSAAGTSRAIEAIAAAGGNPQAARWMQGATSATMALEQQTAPYVTNGKGGAAGIVAQGVVAAGFPYNPADFAGYDLAQRIKSFLNQQGEYDDTAFGISAHGEAMLGLILSGETPDQSAVDFLVNGHEAGNWGDADQNGIALNVLGRLAIEEPSGVTNLAATQLPDGGWGYEASPSNPSSTSEVIQGLVAQGENPFSPIWSQIINGKLANGADAVMAQQLENGCWPNYDGSLDDPYSTSDAIVLLSQKVVNELVFASLLPAVSAP